MIWQFSYHTPYQPETPISARGPLALWLIWVSRVDMGYDMKIAYNNLYIYYKVKTGHTENITRVERKTMVTQTYF